MAITISGENNNDRILASDGVIDQLSGFNVVGVITATSFTGDLTGDVTGNLTGNVTGNINNSTLLLQTGGTERVRITSAGKIGINETSPDWALHVTEGSENARIKIERTGTYGVAGVIFKNTIQEHHIQTNGSNFDLFDATASATRIRIDSNGDVLIGTTTSAGKLTVDSGTSNTCATFKSSDAGAGINLIDNNARSSIEQNGTTLKIVSDTGAEYANSDIRLQVDGSTKMKIDSDGLVTNSATHPQIILKDPSNRQVSLRAPSSSNLAALGTDSSHDLLFYTNGYSNERLRIASDGRPSFYSPAAAWHEGPAVLEASNGYGAIFFRSTGSTHGTSTTGTWSVGKLAGTDGFGILKHGMTGGGAVRVDAALSISNDGHTTIGKFLKTPKRPAFIAGRTGGNQSFTLGTFPLNVARLNVGNHYNTSTYKFVAPVAGVYYFFAQVYYNNGNGYYRVGFRKTPSGGSAIMLNTSALKVVGNDNSQQTSVIEQLSVGDTVELYSDQNSSIQCYYNINDTTYGAHTYFMGYFIG